MDELKLSFKPMQKLVFSPLLTHLQYSGNGFLDNTGANGMKLYCTESDGTLSYVTSDVGAYGQWMGESIRRILSLLH